MTTTVYMSSRGPALIVLSLVLLAISISAIILRIISRRIRKRPFKIDDYLVFLSLVSLLPQTQLCVITNNAANLVLLDRIRDRHPDR